MERLGRSIRPGCLRLAPTRFDKRRGREAARSCTVTHSTSTRTTAPRDGSSRLSEMPAEKMRSGSTRVKGSDHHDSGDAVGNFSAAHTAPIPGHRVADDENLAPLQDDESAQLMSAPTECRRVCGPIGAGFAVTGEIHRDERKPAATSRGVEESILRRRSPRPGTQMTERASCRPESS